MNSDKKNRGIIVFLLLSIIAIGVLSFQNARDYSKLQKAFQDEKVELESELDKIITDYDNAITNKINVSSRLRKEKARIVSLRDSIKGLKEKNYFLIRKFRKRIVHLEKENRFLFEKVDSLNNANTNLYEENLAVKEELNEKSEITYKLSKTNSFLKRKKKYLERRVAKAQALEISDLTVIPMKKKSSGSYTSTSRHKKTEVFKVTFDILKNEVALPGDRNVFIQILDMKGNIISADGNTTLKNGNKLVYSDVFMANFENKEISLVNLVKVKKGSIDEGKYIINVYLEGELAGNRVVEF